MNQRSNDLFANVCNGGPFLDKDFEGPSLWFASSGLSELHGPEHWARVLNNARWLINRNYGPPDKDDQSDGLIMRRMVYWAALYHDCARVDDCQDTGHGGRGALKLLQDYHSGTIPNENPEVIMGAATICAVHTEMMPWSEDDLLRGESGLLRETARVFCDADRLDLTRLQFRIREECLFTSAAFDVLEQDYDATDRPILIDTF